MNPYIGVTGFNDQNQAKEVVQHFRNLQMNHFAILDLMIGVLASNQTISNDPTRTDRYPSFDSIRGIFRYFGEDIVRLIHYNTSTETNLVNELEYVSQKLHHGFEGFQLNLKQIDIRVLNKVRQKFPNKRIILQLKKYYLDDIDSSLQLLYKTLYDKKIDGLVLDPSEGSGQIFDEKVTRKWITNLQHHFPDILITMTGGLNYKNVSDKVNPLINTYNKTVAIDTESGARSNNDQFDINLANAYLTKGFVCYI